jgi:hypothetical protein
VDNFTASDDDGVVHTFDGLKLAGVSTEPPPEETGRSSPAVIGPAEKLTGLALGANKFFSGAEIIVMLSVLPPSKLGEFVAVVAIKLNAPPLGEGIAVCGVLLARDWAGYIVARNAIDASEYFLANI